MKIAALLIGKANSGGYPGKNVMPMLGKPSCEYACMAAEQINAHFRFVSTDSPDIAKIAKRYDFKHIMRPPELATSEALTEDALLHAYQIMKAECNFDVVVLLFANNPAISVNLINEGIELLKNDLSYDSAFSVCRYNMFSPTRARKLENGEIKPFVDLSVFEHVDSIRSSQGDVYFCDLSVQVIRSRVFEDMWDGQLPFRWQGKKSYPLMNTYGFDIDERWQKVAIEEWLREYWYNE